MLEPLLKRINTNSFSSWRSNYPTDLNGEIHTLRAVLPLFASITANINPYIPIIPAIITGRRFFITASGFITPIAEIPTPALAVPYAAPAAKNTIHAFNISYKELLLASTNAKLDPINPKNAGAAVPTSESISNT